MAKNQVVVSVTSNVKGLQKGLGDAQGMLSKFGGLATAAVAAVAAVTVAVGVKAVKSASALEQAMGGLESVFKGNFKQMDAFASKAASSVGLAKSEYANLATVLGSQLKNMGVAQDQLATQTDGLIRTGADLAAQFGGSTSEAVSALSSLLRGERDPIERYGVSINDAAIKAQLATMGLSGLTGEAEKNAKLQATLALLTKQTADAQGAFARESTTLAGSQQRLAAGTENLYAVFGTALLPAVTAVVAALGALVNRVQESEIFQTFVGWLTGASNAFADFVFGILNGTASLDFGSMFSGLLTAAVSGIQSAAQWLASGGAATIVNGIVSGRAAIFNAAFQVFPAILEALVAAIPAIVTGLVALVSQLATMLVTQAPVILGGAVQLFTALVTALVTILPDLIAAIVALLPIIVETVLGMLPALLDTAVELFTALVEALPVVLPMLITAIVALLPKIITTVLDMIPKILQAAVKLFTALVQSLPVILPLLIRAIIDLLPKIITAVLGMIPKLLTAAIDLFIALVEAIPKIIPQLVKALIGLAPKMVSAIIGLVPKLLRAGMDLIGGLVQGLWRAAGSVGTALLDIAKGALDGFLSFFGIKSPSRKMAEQGKYLMQGLAGGITANVRQVAKAMAGVNTSVEAGFNPSLTAPDMSFATSGAALAGNVYNYNIEVRTLNATAETGRLIKDSIRVYEREGGRL